MRCRLLLLLTVLLLACGDEVPVPASQTDDNQARFAALRSSILPTTEELAFEAVRWRPSLRAALEEARATRRPVVLWAMNGHPLGMT